MFSIQPRRIAKVVAHVTTTAVTAYAADAALTAVIGDQDEEDNTLHTGSLMIGGVFGYTLKGYTDSAVDRVADWRANRKLEKNLADAVVES